jgi:hypothetical protein
MSFDVPHALRGRSVVSFAPPPDEDDGETSLVMTRVPAAGRTPTSLSALWIRDAAATVFVLTTTVGSARSEDLDLVLSTVRFGRSTSGVAPSGGGEEEAVPYVPMPKLRSPR